jgi:putative CocE/NonD family hydrolase
MDQLRWFDHWLKDIDTGLMEEPPVKLEIRTGGSPERYPFRTENEWPLARTQWTRYYLKVEREPSSDPHASEGTLTTTAPATAAKLAYSASGVTKAGVASGSSLSTTHGNVGRSGVSFETPAMTEDMELTGPLAMKLWVSSTSEDMDIFVTLRNIGPENEDVCEVGQHGQPVPCLTKGWLRASHRKLDPELSKPWRPYHPHEVKEPLVPGKVVELDIEILPTSIVVPAGHRVALTIRGKDYVYPGPAGVLSNMKYPMTGCGPFTHTDSTDRPAKVFDGVNTLHVSARNAPYVLLPIIPAQPKRR